MRLVNPTDYKILAFLAASGRNNAVNIAAALELDRSYINTRLRALSDAEYLARVGPAANSGLYEITEAGCEEVARWAGVSPERIDEVEFDRIVAAGDD